MNQFLYMAARRLPAQDWLCRAQQPATTAQTNCCPRPAPGAYANPTFCINLEGKSQQSPPCL
ncbi:hypothetical protein A2U01_0070959 [Trifolium medium]|uniref:Uncharacterized protein n=1 Tax=Trifolium medium TaxID=97028 RepID=A0A392SNX1_9FABA|nr:hypothetical protein [Trifolium medium]